MKIKKQAHTTGRQILDVIREGERVQYGNLCEKLRDKGYPEYGLYSALREAGCLRVGGTTSTERRLVERPPRWRTW